MIKREEIQAYNEAEERKKMSWEKDGTREVLGAVAPQPKNLFERLESIEDRIIEINGILDVLPAASPNGYQVNAILESLEQARIERKELGDRDYALDKAIANLDKRLNDVDDPPIALLERVEKLEKRYDHQWHSIKMLLGTPTVQQDTLDQRIMETHTYINKALDEIKDGMCLLSDRLKDIETYTPESNAMSLQKLREYVDEQLDDARESRNLIAHTQQRLKKDILEELKGKNLTTNLVVEFKSGRKIFLPMTDKTEVEWGAYYVQVNEGSRSVGEFRSPQVKAIYPTPLADTKIKKVRRLPSFVKGFVIASVFGIVDAAYFGVGKVLADMVLEIVR